MKKDGELREGTARTEAVVADESTNITILYLTQSGTAETFAKDLCKEAKAVGMHAKTVDIEEYEYETRLAKESYLIVYVSTHGEGDPVDTALAFTDWLYQDDLDETLLSSVKFAVFGLGNKQHEHYNNQGKKLDKRLEQLGGKRNANHEMHIYCLEQFVSNSAGPCDGLKCPECREKLAVEKFH